MHIMCVCTHVCISYAIQYIYIYIAQSLKRQGEKSQCRIMPESNDYMTI